MAARTPSHALMPGAGDPEGLDDEEPPYPFGSWTTGAVRRALAVPQPTRLLLGNQPRPERAVFWDPGLCPEGAAELAEKLDPEYAVIEEVDLSYNSIAEKGIAALAPVLERLPLRSLDLRGNWIGDEGVHLLRSALAGKKTLEVLRLGDNAVRNGRTLVAVAELAGALPSLRTLDLDHVVRQERAKGDSDEVAVENQGEAFSALSAMIAVHPALEELGLLGFLSEAQPMESFAYAILQAKTLRTLRLDGPGTMSSGHLADALGGANQLKMLAMQGPATLEEFRKLCTSLASSTTLEDVSLQPTFPRQTDIDLREAALMTIGRTLLKCVSLRRLLVDDAPYSSLHDMKREANSGVIAIADSLANGSKLEELTLLKFSVNDAGLSLLGSALQGNEALKVLVLDPCAAGDETNDGGAAALAAALAGANRYPRFRAPLPLEVLRLGSHRVGHGGADALADALPRTTFLRELDLTGSNIRSRGAARLAQGLKRNKSLRKLCLEDNKIGSLGATAFGSALTVNHTLEELNLAVNPIGADGAEELAAGLVKNSGLLMLDLSKCQLGGEGIRALCQAVLMNDTLRNLATGGGYPELSKALSSSERAANAQRMRRTLEARDQPPQGLALPLRKWLRMADLDVDRTCTLGSGGFGKVFRGRYLDLDVAVKEPLLRGDEEAEAVLEAEIAASVDLPQHPNVADILGYHIQPTFLVTRLYTGDLAGFLRQRGWNRTLALRLLADAAQGVRALHAAGIVHADLKPGNVLVDLAPGDPDDRAVAKIADFGLARSRNRVRGAQGTAYEYVGFGGFSLRYAPPEQLRGEGFGRASDIWSFGMLCYTILSEDTEPYAGLSHVSIMFHIEQGTLPNPLLRWDDWELIRWICAKDKLERPSVEEIAARLRSMAAAAAEESPAGSAASSTEAPALNEMDRTVSVAASVPDVTRSVG